MAKGSSTTSLVSTGGSNSLRTTIPMWIVEQFDLKPGSKIEWSLSAKNDAMTISVTPQE
jgi:antitoxin component of MazEF toxin-antitoxin module